ncbi:DUF2147 domain-containing protein [Geobacter sp. DSM 9736]|uniref:DUF2147 domain-containing protein n=1 Tax=Geobacter sp. DSM 9736 TaxID=1277350 RepID=UPI000B504CDB|nr:DUF2147 domain-containing protein [Geobacter sp. DSM 9736]SNB47151.1 Uncharacterized conserved protein, DUF2147 family [Geobacter sp. DSM 9736]
MRLLYFTLAFVMAATGAFASSPDNILGVWLTAGGDSKVELFRCGDNDNICGRIVWLKEPRYRDNRIGPIGTVKTDRRNPEQDLRNRSLLGLQVMNGLVQTGEKQWEHGSCYDPHSGKTYNCKMKLTAPDMLELRGYVGISLFGRTFQLTRSGKDG